MKKLLVIAFSIVTFVGCKSVNSTVYDDKTINSYFVGGGEEPFWDVKISNETIEFTSLYAGYEKFNFPHSEPARAMDANVKRYYFTSEDFSVTIQVFQRECVNSMSGEISKYAVKVEIKKNNESKTKVFDGCGKYVVDYRLHDIWVLDQLKGKTVTSDDFARELPNMEIDAAKASFMGYAGCNRMFGKLFSEREILRFTNIGTTEMACIGGNREMEFLQALQSTTTYKIENNRLWLSNNYGMQLVFKKVD